MADFHQLPNQLIPCPICLADLDWATLAPGTIEAGLGFRPLNLAPTASANQRYRAEQHAVVRCPNEDEGEHFLPYQYGRHGQPVVLGLIGLSAAGKTHLLAALVNALDQGSLSRELGLTCIPVDRRQHAAFMDERVVPLFDRGDALSATEENITLFADAFLITSGGRSTVVAIFDVAGGELSSVKEKQFLYVADGLMFVVDPASITPGQGGLREDRTFSETLNLLGGLGRNADVCAAIAVTKADLLRFEEPIDVWMRRPVTFDPAAITAESRDVYAYLHSIGAPGWLRPYADCGKATLHVVSATGGSSRERKFPRGVVSHRVLGPFVALLAMTGVLTTPDADLVGVH
jgi:hypothetical protein